MNLCVFNWGLLKAARPPHLFLAMKITGLLLMVTLLHASAATYSQISLNEHNTSLKTVLKKITQQSGYTFFYDTGDMGDNKVSIQLKDGSLKDALSVCLKDLPLSFKIVQKSVVLIRTEKSLFNKITDFFVSKTVKGIIVNDKGEPLAGATVSVKGRAVITNEKGFFLLDDVDDGAILEISYIGYVKKEIVAKADVGTVRMEPSSSKLDEIQVIAYGTTTKRMNLGSVATIQSEDIKRQPVADVLQALQSNVPGLEISQVSGMPGTGYSAIHIRGVNSLNSGSNPLFLVDGVEITGTNDYLFGVDPFSGINPSDIESVSVLKDADATAIYGSKGANGVILVTTKRGKAGLTKVNANIYHGINNHAQGYKLLNTQQYLEMRREAFKNDGDTPDEFNAPDLTGYGTGSDINRYTNWDKAINGQQGLTTDAQVSVSGGDASTTFLISAGLHRESPPMPVNYFYSRPSVHFNITNASKNKRFNISLNGSYSVANSNFAIDDISYAIPSLPPNLPELKNPDGSYNFYSSIFNPYATLGATNRIQAKTLISNAAISYKLGAGFELKSTFGYTDLNSSTVSLSPLAIQDPSFQLTSGNSSFVSRTVNSWQIAPQLEYVKIIGQGKLTALLGGTYQDITTQYYSIFADDFSSDALLEDYSAANTTFVSSSYRRYKYLAAFTRINYAYKDKYLLNLTARRDGSSRFGPGRQFGNFGAAGAGWIFSNEDFAKNTFPWLSFGKLRTSYGITGNDQIGDYQYLDTYTSTSVKTAIGATVSGLHYDGINPLSPRSLYNPDYGWETTRKLEAGLDIGLFNDRILLNATWYNNKSSSQLVNFSLAPTTGFPGIFQNLPAKVGNQGWELSTNSVNIKNDVFNWKTTFNISIPRNKLLAFPGLATSSYSNTYVIGQPLSVLKVYKYLGVDPQTGIYTFADANGNPTATPTEVTDQQTLVSLDKKFYGGFSNTFQYKAFQLTIDLQFVKQKAYDNTIFSLPPGSISNYSVDVMSRWQKPGDITNIQKFTQNTSTDAYLAAVTAMQSERIFTDGSFIRVKNVALSYDVDKRFLDKLHISNLRIYANAQNLLTFTHYPGSDPETGSLGYLPSLKTVIAGIQCTF